MERFGRCFSARIFSQTRVIARAYSTCSSNFPMDRVTPRERSSLRMASAGISHIVVSIQGPSKVRTYCPSCFSRW